MGNCVEIPKKLIQTAKNLGVRGNDTQIKLALEQLHNESDGSIDIFNLTKKDQVAIQSKINESVSRAKEEKIAQSNTLIENVPMAIASSKDGYTKTTAVKNSDTLYVFEDNLQAKNAVSESPIGETIVVPNGPKLNVQSGPAIIRTNTNGDINKNTIGLVFKKNQQDSQGKWIREQGDFQDTDEDLKLFKEANKQAIQDIVNALKSGQYKKIVFPKTMGEQMAKLPQRFLEELVSMLNEIGVISNVQMTYSSTREQHFYLEVEKVDKKLAAQEIKDKKKKDGSVQATLDEIEQQGATFGRLRENEKFLNETVDITLQNAFNALKALNMTAPIIGAFDAIQSQDVLKTEFPDLMIRQNRINYISGRFSEKLEDLLYDRVQELKERQQSTNPTDALTEDEEQELRDLTGGTVEQQRIAFLNTTINGMSAVHYIIDSIKQDISFFSGVDVEALTELLLDPNSDLTYAINFNDEFYRLSGADLKAKAKERAAHMLEAFAKMQDPQIFNALMQRAADELAFTENVRIDITDGKASNNNEKQEEFDEQQEEQEESENANTEGYMVKFRTTDPISSLTLKIKKILGECYSISYRNGEAHYNYDDIGNIQRMDALTAFAILHDAMSDMKGPEDFVKCVDAAIEKYPWLSTIRDYIIKNPENEDCYDEDVRNEFYRIFRRVYEQYGYITQSGKLKWLNKNDTAAALLSNATNNYESRTRLTELSVYNSDGTYNIKNIIKIQKLFRADKDAPYKNDYYQVTRHHPYFYVKTILKDFINNKGKLSKLIEALDIINGENKQINDAFGVNIGISNLLRAIGIDTNNINMAQIAPYIDDDIREAVENKDITVEEFAGEVFSVEQASKLLRVMDALETITYQDTEGLQDRLQQGLHLTNVFQSKYMQIGSALGGAIEGYTAATFRDFEGKTRASFVPPSFISDFCGMMQDTEHSERGTKWLIENYLCCDLYGGKYAEDIRKKQQLLDQGKTEEAAKIVPNYKDIPFLWLRELMDPDNNYEKRKTFQYFNCLGYMGEESDNTVGKATIENRLLGWICSYFAGNTNSSGQATAWYRSIPFSDVDAAVHFRAQRFSKGRKYNGRTFKQVIIDECYKILEGEIKKIKHYDEYQKDPNKIEIEHFTDKRNNSTKFQFFPSLNEEKDNILYIYTHGVEIGAESNLESGKEIVESREKLLKEKIAQLLEKEFDEFYTTQVTDRIRAKISSIIDNTSKEQEEESEEKSKLEKEVDKQQSIRDIYNEEKALKELREKQIKESLEEFFYNDFLAQLNIQPILGGDPGLYKNFEDLIKRNKQSYSSGERLFSAEVNPETGEVIKTLTQKTMYLEDFYRRSTTWQYVKDLLESDKNMSSTTRFVIQGFIESYKNICTTDGQSYRTPESFKQIFQALGGKWNEDLERAYNNLMNGTPSVQDFISLWQPIKPFVQSAQFLNLGGRTEKITTQHKNSECLMTALFSCLQSAITKSPLLTGLQQFMAKHNVDVCHFHSVVKEGHYEPFDLEFNERAFKKALKDGLIINGKEIKSNQSLKDAYKQYMKELDTALDKGIINQEEYNENFNKFQLEYASPEDVVYQLDQQLAAKQEKEKVTNNEGKLAFKTFPLKDYQIVQPTDDHLTDSEAINGSQASNIVPADLSPDFEMPMPLWGRSTKFKFQETQYFYNALKTQQMLDAFKAINSEYSTIEKLQAALLRKIEGNPQYGPDVIEALQIKDGQFAVPFNCPNLSNKIEALILSVFKNEIQRMKIDGGNATLVSNFGLSKDLRIEYRKDSDGNVTGIEYIEAYLPFWASDFVKDFLVQKDDYFVIDEEKIAKSMGKKQAEKLLRIIGYRIPTENKYSMFPIRVKGFVPAVAGGTIILPADIVNMSGTDFKQY